MIETDEDRTFRILKQTPRAEVKKELERLHMQYAYLDYDRWINLKEIFLKKHGWTMYEFHKQREGYTGGRDSNLVAKDIVGP